MLIGPNEEKVVGVAASQVVAFYPVKTGLYLQRTSRASEKSSKAFNLKQPACIKYDVFTSPGQTQFSCEAVSGEITDFFNALWNVQMTKQVPRTVNILDSFWKLEIVDCIKTANELFQARIKCQTGQKVVRADKLDDALRCFKRRDEVVAANDSFSARWYQKTLKIVVFAYYVFCPFKKR